jgi:hypothetical protein
MAFGKPAPSGMEAMLRAMGLGQIIEVANQLATSGAVEKILKFASEADELNRKLDRIERHLARYYGEPVPGPRPPDAGSDADASRVAHGTLAGPSSHSGLGTYRAATLLAHHDGTGSVDAA